MYTTIPHSAYHQAFSGSIESNEDLRIAFECLRSAHSYAHFLVTTKCTPPGMTVTTATKHVK